MTLGARELWWSLARKLYAASLWSAGQEPEAMAEIEATLRDDPDASLDEVQFDLVFSRLFGSVRDRMQPELARLREERLRQRQRDAELESLRRRELNQRLSTETRVEGSRWTILLPFGGAQFANHQPSLGFFFLGLETLALGTNILTFVSQRNFERSLENLTDPSLRVTLRAVEGVNYVSLVVLAASLAGGLIHAAITYSPRTRSVPRPVPASLQNLQISLSLGGSGPVVGALSLNF